MRIPGQHHLTPADVSGTAAQDERLPWTAPVATVMNLRDAQFGVGGGGDGCGGS